MRVFSIPILCGLLLSAASSSAAEKTNSPQAASAPASTAAPAAADAAPLPDAYAPHGILLSARVGPSFPQLYNKLATNALGQLDVAYQFSWNQQALGVFFGVGYTQPTLKGVQQDARLDVNGGADAFTMTVRDVGFSVGVQYLLQLPMHFVGYAGLGAELHLTRTALWQTAGSVDAGYTYENSTRFGPLVRLGAGYPLGPGLLCFELRQEYTGIDHTLTGLKNTAALSTLLGYTLKL